MRSHEVDVAVVGAAIVGIATAYYLAVQHGRSRIAIVDIGQPMALTSARSGENYRNWWPHPTMTDFTDHSISLMEDIARSSKNRIHMTRRGYLLCTREANPDALLRQLYVGYGPAAEGAIRIHVAKGTGSYQPPHSAEWDLAPSGVDVLCNRDLIRQHYPYLDPQIATIFHVRRAGDISGQQLGQYMLEQIRALGGRLRQARVAAIAASDRFALDLITDEEREVLRCDIVVNAAGPFAGEVSALHGETLPIVNVLQQKIAFVDRLAAVPRQLPFTVDLDGQAIAWTREEREVLAGDPSISRFVRPMPGNIHCRPDGAERGQWIKLGWSYNTNATTPSREPALDPHFPEIVVRATSRMLPRLKSYIGSMPRERSHYGGYYAMTRENWPLIGPSRTPGVFLATALSGYGTMAACAAGDLCARSIAGAALPVFAKSLSIERYLDQALMLQLESGKSRGLLYRERAAAWKIPQHLKK